MPLLSPPPCAVPQTSWATGATHKRRQSTRMIDTSTGAAGTASSAEPLVQDSADPSFPPAASTTLDPYAVDVDTSAIPPMPDWAALRDMTPAVRM